MEKQAITIYDVAREAGVSMATVSRVVNGNPNVKPSTRRKVSDVIERLNYRPNAVARGLASKKTTTVGVIIPNITNLFFSALARGIDDIASMYKYHIMIANYDQSIERSVQVFHNLLAKQVDGIIYMGFNIDPTIKAEIDRANIPVVFAGTVVDDPSYYTINIDYVQAVKDVTDFLLGHDRRIALITGPEMNEVNHERVAGYEAALANRNLALDPELIFQGNYNYLDGERLYERMKEVGASACITDTDEVGVAINNAVFKDGLSVPEDYEIITSHNSILVELSRPVISSIQLPVYDMGAVAMRLLTKIMNNEQVDENRVILPYRFIQRGSTLSE